MDAAEPATGPSPKLQDFLHTGPGTLAGRYLRQFWQPIYHSADLAPSRAAPVRIMSQDFALYRGESGAPHLLDPRCPHRGTQLSAGRVEGECIRCFYHGWKFDASGQCVEQPVEDSEFAHKVRLPSYPTEEYLGLIFAFLGDGEPPPLPRFADFENFAGLVEIDSYRRNCNYFNNIDNALDMSHVGFVHGDNRASYQGIGLGRALQAEESDWGVTYTFTRADGQRRVQQFGMPNAYNLTALPNDPDIGWQESLFWWVPIDDLHHIQFSVHRVPVTGAVAERVRQRRQARRSEIDLDHVAVCEDILAGRLHMSDVDPSRVDLVRLQDDIAQVGQGRILNPGFESLGRGDVGVIAVRKLWAREMRALATGGSLKSWTRSADIAPESWGLGGPTGGAVVPGASWNSAETAKLEDVRPYIEVAAQLELLAGRAGP